MSIRVWKGHHCEEIRELIGSAWKDPRELLVLCPPDVDPVLVPGDFSDFAFPEPPVLGIFTSGTQARSASGARRLVIYSKANIQASLGAILEHLDSARIDSIFCYPQPFHTFGLLLGYVLSLEKGWRLFAGEGKYGSGFHDLWLKVSRQSPGLLTLGTPTHFQDLLSHGASGAGPTASCIIGGAKVYASTWRQIRDELRIEKPSIGYGATEASPGISHLPSGREPREDGEIGFLLRDIRVRPDSRGGFSFQGPSVCMAIAELSQNSPPKIESPREISIADEISRREDGVWIYRGRCDLVLNRGGSKFSLADIEDLISRRLGTEVLALAVPHERLGQELGLLIAGENIPSEAIQAFLSERFSVSFDPDFFLRVPKIPMNENLKPDREKGLQLLLKKHSALV